MRQLSPVESMHVKWLEKNAPGIVEAFKHSLRREMMGTVAPTESGGIVDKLFGFAQAYTQYKGQRDIIKAQMERARQGQPPLDTSQISMPPLRVETELGRDTRAAMVSSIGNMLPWIAGGIALTMAFIILRKPKRAR